MSVDFNCGQRVISSCQGKSIEMSEAGWQALFGEISSDAQFLIKFAIMNLGSDLTILQVKGINSLRCMFSSGFENSWYILAALYYFALQFGYQNYLSNFVNQYYPYICTCTDDANKFAGMFGNTNSQQQKILTTCSESAATSLEYTSVCTDTSKHTAQVYTYDINLPAGPSSSPYVIHAGDIIQFEGLNTYAQYYITGSTCDGIIQPLIYSSDTEANRNRLTSFYAPIYDFDQFMNLPTRQPLQSCTLSLSNLRQPGDTAQIQIQVLDCESESTVYGNAQW